MKEITSLIKTKKKEVRRLINLYFRAAEYSVELRKLIKKG